MVREQREAKSKQGRFRFSRLLPLCHAFVEIYAFSMARLMHCRLLRQKMHARRGEKEREKENKTNRKKRKPMASIDRLLFFFLSIARAAAKSPRDETERKKSRAVPIVVHAGPASAIFRFSERTGFVRLLRVFFLYFFLFVALLRQQRGEWEQSKKKTKKKSPLSFHSCLFLSFSSPFFFLPQKT